MDENSLPCLTQGLVCPVRLWEVKHRETPGSEKLWEAPAGRCRTWD